MTPIAQSGQSLGQSKRHSGSPAFLRSSSTRTETRLASGATPLYRRLESEGRILSRDWELYDGQHVVFRPRRLSVDELQRGTESAWRHAYGWRGIVARLRKSPAPLHLALLSNLGYRHYARRLSRFYSRPDLGAAAKRPALSSSISS